MNVRLINPANEEVIREIESDSGEKVQKAIAESVEAFGHWRQTELDTRARCVRDFAQAIHGSRLPLAENMTREMGKTLKDSLSEVDKCATSCEFLAENYPRWKSETEYSLPTGFSVTRQPLGVTFGIMPWNFPLWQVVRFAVPSMLSGNSVLLKHSPNTWGSAMMIADLFRAAFPDSLYINLNIDVEGASQVIADPRVRGVSLTGSRRAGVSVGEQAGRHLKKCVLELGGSDAYVILDDANVEKAAEICAASRLINGGQSCVSAKRFIVTKKNAAEFTEVMRNVLVEKKPGDPLNSSTDFGPMARKDLRDGLHKQVLESTGRGAKLILGGKVPDKKGFFYPASILTNVLPGQPAFDEELFGPVAAIIIAEDEKKAMALANQSRYGLGSAIFSRDTKRAKELAEREMEAGMVFINDYVKSDPSVPFGGVKDSGLGRELGRDGCFEFTNTKTVYSRD